MSRTLTEVPSHIPDVVSIDPVEPRAFAKNCIEQRIKHIYLDGGQVIQSFLREGLVDEMTITIIPVLIGEGIPLFEKFAKDIKLKLLRTRSWTNSMAQSTYQVLK